MLRNWTVFNKLPPEQLIRVKYIHVFEGGRSALYVTSGDIVYGIGANGNYNLLGLSGRHRHFSLVLEPVSVERLSLKSITAIAVGDYFGVANNTNGELYHWGRRMDRRRGILLPHQVKCPFFVTNIACGSEFFVILTKEQKVYFRGTFQQNDHPILEFTEVSVGLSVSSISCGIYHCAMLSTDGQVYNCGYDHHATYRTWKTEEGMIPKKLDLREQCIQVVCGRRSTVCLLNSGSVWACGENDNLGVDSDNSVMKNPVIIRIMEPIRELAATWFSNIYAASSWSGRIYCWGHKTKRPTIITDACVLLDAFSNKETPSSLGIIPVAPQLTPYSSFNTKTFYRRSAVEVMNPDVALRLARSLSADDLSTSHYPPDKSQSDRNNNEKNIEVESSNTRSHQQQSNPSKPNKNLPPGFGLLISAGKFLATRPSDRQNNSALNGRRREVSPESRPSKNPKLQLSIGPESAAGLSGEITRSQSMENLDSQPSSPSKKKLNVLTTIFGREAGRRAPLTSPQSETVPKTPEPDTNKASESPTDPRNPFFEYGKVSHYPKIPLLTEEEDSPQSRMLSTTKEFQKRKFSTTNPFLYDPMEAIKFEFEGDAAQLYTENISGAESLAKKPLEKSSIKNFLSRTQVYNNMVADIKSDVIELQTIINELAKIVQDL